MVRLIWWLIRKGVLYPPSFSDPWWSSLVHLGAFCGLCAVIVLAVAVTCAVYLLILAI
jgi:hypothetical protein